MNIIYVLVMLLFPFLFVTDQAFKFPLSSPHQDSVHVRTTHKVRAAKIVFKSADGGQTWQDISEGLPERVKNDDAMARDVFFTNGNGLYLNTSNGIYHTTANSKAPFWEKEILPHSQPRYFGEHSSITAGKKGIFAYNYWEGQFLQKINGTSLWSPMFTNFQQTSVRTVFETAGGTVFVGTDNGLFKSANSGKTWKQVHTGDWVMKMVESNGVLVATSMRGIIRSADNGENWSLVISEGGVGIAVEPIKAGFAAISYSTTSNTRRVRASYDAGKTWQPIDDGLPAQLSISSIVQVGENFFCGHPIGIFRSSDKGKTWKLLLPSVEGKVFNLSVSGSVIYAIPSNEGC